MRTNKRPLDGGDGLHVKRAKTETVVTEANAVEVSVRQQALEAIASFSKKSVAVLTAAKENTLSTRSKMPLKQLAIELLAIDKTMRETFQRLHTHQAFYHKTKHIKAQTQAKDNQILFLAKQLQRVEKQMEDLSNTAKDKLDVIKQANTAASDVDSIINYARLVCFTTAAPMDRDTASSLHTLPYPLEAQIQATHLFREMSGNLGQPQQENQPEEQPEEEPLDMHFPAPSMQTHTYTTEAEEGVDEDDLLSL